MGPTMRSAAIVWLAGKAKSLSTYKVKMTTTKPVVPEQFHNIVLIDVGRYYHLKHYQSQRAKKTTFNYFDYLRRKWIF